METRFIFFSFLINFVLVLSYPADHREDTVLPFSLSPGNVNLETFYLNKYPKPGSNGQEKKKEAPSPLISDGNGVQEEEQQQNTHGLFRSRRSPNSVFHNRGHQEVFHGQSGNGNGHRHTHTHSHHHNHHHNALHHQRQYSRYGHPQQGLRY